MSFLKKEFGNTGEKLAADFLVKNGYDILDKNYRVKNIGEIDIVAYKREKIVFFEVKTRNVSCETNFPIQFSINHKKKSNLKKICQVYLMNNKYLKNKEWQVDALFVMSNSENGFKIEHLENILWEKYY